MKSISNQSEPRKRMRNHKTIKYLVIIAGVAFATICFIVGKRVYDYYNDPIYLQFVPIAEVYTERDLGDGGYWSMVFDEDHSVVRKYNIQLPEVDFSKYNLLFSTARELKQLSYKRGETLPYGSDVYKGYPVFKKELHPHTIFFYKVEKIRIHEDDFGAPEPIKIED